MKISARYLVGAYRLRCSPLPVFGQLALRIAACHPRYCRLASIRQVACIFIAVWSIHINCAISSCYVPSTMLNWIAVNQFSYDIQSIVLRISLKFGINEYFEYSIATAVLFCLRCKLVRHEGSTDHQYSPIAISSPMASLKNSLAHEIFAKCPLL
jgi:hypothetical protein